MDLYSEAHRLSQPFVFEEPGLVELPIGARAPIGDGHSCALVRVDGVIDWLCMPRFDSPSVFGALIGHENGGCSGITPVSRPFESLQRYDPGTNVLETLFRVGGQGVVRLTDFMPWTGDPRASIHEVHRRIECLDGAVELNVIFDPRFDYGRDTPSLQVQEHGVRAASSSGRAMVAVLNGDAIWSPRPAGGMESTFRLSAGQRRWMVLSWDAPHAESVAAYRPFEHLRATRHRWREWSRRLDYDGPWRHHVLRSALLLKLLMYAPTGAMVAAPTTSLPEWIGGERNWDYRFAWTRDAAMGVRAMNLIGFVEEARDYFYFVRDTLEHAVDGGPDVMYSVDGGPVPDEELLPHLRGFSATGPVRIGNGANTQQQFDTVGALLDAAYLYERSGGSTTLRTWRRMCSAVEAAAQRWPSPDHGIWEPRCDPRHNVHSKLMSWLALDRGSQLAPLFGARQDATDWRQVAAKIRGDLCANGLDGRRERFVAAYGTEDPDAALLLIPIHGFLDAADPRVDRTVRWVQQELSTGPFLYRYKNDDGVGGREGAFVLCGFWLAEALALAGRLEEAQQVFVAHAQSSNHVGLLAEEIDPGSRELLGNFPQAFSHLGLINAAARIDLALRLRDEGSRQRPRWGFNTGNWPHVRSE